MVVVYISKGVVCKMSYLSKWKDIVWPGRLIVTCTKKKLKFWPLGLLFDMLSRDSAAITLRVCHVYIEEGCYEVHVGLEVNLRGLVRWIVDFRKKPE